MTELKAKEQLSRMGATLIIRSAGSKSPADLVAVFPQLREIWFVQVKSSNMPKNSESLRRRFQRLSELKGDYTCKAVVYAKRNGRYEFTEV
jgi:hypothetical protein